MRVLVTGGAGYIGSVTVEALVAAGHAPVVLDDCSTGHAGAVPEGVPFVRQDYTDELATTDALRKHGIEAILHCAARSLVGESVREPSRYYRQNVAGGIALLEAARTAGVRRVVFSSTAAVYGVPDTTPIPEDVPLRPINPYGETKRTFEGALDWYGRAYGLRGVSLRYFNAAGASAAFGEEHAVETHLIPSILAAVERDEIMTLFGGDYPTPDGTPIRDYIHVVDLADAHIRALEATGRDDAPAFLACNLGNGSGFSVHEVVAAAEAIVGRPIQTRIGPRREGDPPVLIARPDRARETLGWEPRHGTLADMIGSAWAWRRAHPAGYGDRA